MSDERLMSVEMKLMHLEEQLEDMNSVVLGQASMIERLKRKLEMTEDKLQTLASDAQSDGGMGSIEAMALEKPPHF